VGLNNKNPGPTQPDIFYAQNKNLDFIKFVCGIWTEKHKHFIQ